MNHDTTHCNNKSCELYNDCSRFVALRVLKKENSKLPEEQQTHYIDMLFDAEQYCIEKNFRYFKEHENTK